MDLPPSIRNGKNRGWKKHKLPQSNKKIAMLFFFFLAKSPQTEQYICKPSETDEKLQFLRCWQEFINNMQQYPYYRKKEIYDNFLQLLFKYKP